MIFFPALPMFFACLLKARHRPSDLTLVAPHKLPISCRRLLIGVAAMEYHAPYIFQHLRFLSDALRLLAETSALISQSAVKTKMALVIPAPFDGLDHAPSHQSMNNYGGDRAIPDLAPVGGRRSIESRETTAVFGANDDSQTCVEEFGDLRNIHDRFL